MFKLCVINLFALISKPNFGNEHLKTRFWIDYTWPFVHLFVLISGCSNSVALPIVSTVISCLTLITSLAVIILRKFLNKDILPKPKWRGIVLPIVLHKQIDRFKTTKGQQYTNKHWDKLQSGLFFLDLIVLLVVIAKSRH